MQVTRPGENSILSYKNSRSWTLTRAGRLFLMCITQNGYDQKTRGQNNHKFFICTHNTHRPPLGLGMGENTSPSSLGKYIIVMVQGLRCLVPPKFRLLSVMVRISSEQTKAKRNYYLTKRYPVLSNEGKTSPVGLRATQF